MSYVICTLNPTRQAIQLHHTFRFLLRRVHNDSQTIRKKRKFYIHITAILLYEKFSARPFDTSNCPRRLDFSKGSVSSLLFLVVFFSSILFSEFHECVSELFLRSLMLLMFADWYITCGQLICFLASSSFYVTNTMKRFPCMIHFHTYFKGYRND